MTPSKLHRQAEFLDKYPQADAVYSGVTVVMANGERHSKQHHPVDPFRLMQRCPAWRIAIMIRQRVLAKMGQFDESISGSDDWDMWIRMTESCSFGQIPEALSEYVIHGQNISKRRPNQLSHVRRMRFEVVKRASARRGHPMWLRAMTTSAWVYWGIGRIPYLGRRFPYFWAALDRVQFGLELAIIRPFSRSPQPNERLNVVSDEI
jgi:hypothetical protein